MNPNEQIIKVQTQAPSNIAIVKYWGKKGLQLPANPSMSFTLSKALTEMEVSYEPGQHNLKITFLFEGRPQPTFHPKLYSFLEKLQMDYPILNTGQLYISSKNTFPHSSGIASSASSMAALANAIYEILEKMGHVNPDKKNTISRMARLGSGSACRSTSLGWNLWGQTDLINIASDEYAISVNSMINPIFESIHDSILVIRTGAKPVSSTTGHQLMENHPYKEARIKQANENMKRLYDALRNGDFNDFSEVCEEEAMSLHALMMSSRPGYTLLDPSTLEVIRRLKEFRSEQRVPVTFTLDAGPNLHILYPDSHKKAVQLFIMIYLRPFCEDNQVIHDQISFPTLM